MKDKDSVTKMQFVDLNMWMVGDILLKADKMSMANSLSCGCLSWTRGLWPWRGGFHKVPCEQREHQVRHAESRPAADAGEVGRQKEAGFPVPTRVWLKEDKYYNVVKEEFLGENAQKFSTRRSW